MFFEKCVPFVYLHPRGFFFFPLACLSVAAITMWRGKLAPHLLFVVLRKFLPILCLCCKSIHPFFKLWFLLLLSCFESPFLELCKWVSPWSSQLPWQKSPWPLPFPHHSLPAECRGDICLKVLFSSGFSALFLRPPNPMASSSRLNSSVSLPDPAPQSVMTPSVPASLQACEDSRERFPRVIKMERREANW